MERKKGLSSFALKWIAVISMILDHVGYMLAWEVPFPVWKGLRIVGRLAFPIYCFLLVEGFYHTRDVKKYLLRLGIFAVISEVPFDLLFRGQVWNPDYQNVFVTLFIGLLLLYLYNRFLANVQPIYALMTLISMLCLAFLVRCDYGAEGVLIIFLFFYFRFRPVPMFISVGLVMILMGGIEVFAPAAFLPIAFYNGEKGVHLSKGNRGQLLYQYIFYGIYPLHLLLLAGIRYIIFT